MKKEILIKPLTVNKAWQGKRFKTKDYKEYEEKLLWLLKGLEKTDGFVEVIYKLYLKYYSTSDVGNFEKPLTDIIVKAGLINDDKYITKITMEKFKSEEDKIIIEII
jgi:Holliday junction resolvase RusA-like endonuclease